MEQNMKKQSTFRNGKRIGQAVFFMILVLSMALFRNAAKAEINLLKVSETIVYAGDQVTISEYFSDKEVTDIVYETDSAHTNEESAVLDEKKGIVKTNAAGTYTVQVSYQSENQRKTELFSVVIREPEEITATYGSLLELQAFSVYSQEDYPYLFSKDSAALADGALLIQGFQECLVSVQAGGRKIDVAKIQILMPEFEAGNQLVRATDTEAYTPALKNYQPLNEGDNNIQWRTEEESIASVTEKGILAAKEGSTKVTAFITAKNSDTAEVSATLTVTNPKVEQEVYAIAKGLTKTITITGTCEYSTYEYDTEDTGCAYFIEKNELYANYKGTTELTLTVDGRQLVIKAVVTNPKYSHAKFTMYKGLKKNLSLSGINKTYSKITYKSSNTKIVKISETGKAHALKTGVAKIKAKADGKTVTVWIEISTKKAYRAAKKEIAISKTKTRYSQAKRMRKGYYDCSSIVSRVYRKYGVYFGRRSGWSPTAAAIGQWCTRHHKVIARKGVSSHKLVPGDLIFYSYKRNGRYRNISHIEMYVGNGKSVSASSRMNRVVHYGYSSSSVVLIARPTK